MKLYFLLLSASLTILLSSCGGSVGKSSTNETPIPSSSVSTAKSEVSSSLSNKTSSSAASSMANSSSTASVSFTCTPHECEANNKAVVLKIYTDVINKDQIDLIDSIFDAKVILHLPEANNGSTGEMAHLQTLKNDTPSYVATIKHIAADGEYVAVHWHLSPQPNNEFNGKAVIDLYKFSDNKIVEHWFLSKNLPSTTASGNSLFSDLYIYAGDKPQSTQSSEAENKELVTSVYLGLFNDKNLGLIDQYIDPSYLQHNPYVPDGREALRAFVSARIAGGLSFFATVADDDLVWTFSGDGYLKLVDMFRVDNKKIVEHYDVF